MKFVKEITLNLNLGRGHIFTVLLFGLLCFFPLTLGSETLQVTTYYPSPYGTHGSAVRVTERLDVFHSNTGTRIVSPLDSGEGVANTIRIISSGDLYIAPAYSSASRGRIFINTGTISLGTTGYLDRLCRWIAIATAGSSLNRIRIANGIVNPTGAGWIIDFNQGSSAHTHYLGCYIQSD